MTKVTQFARQMGRRCGQAAATSNDDDDAGAQARRSKRNGCHFCTQPNGLQVQISICPRHWLPEGRRVVWAHGMEQTIRPWQVALPGPVECNAAYAGQGPSNEG